MKLVEGFKKRILKNINTKKFYFSTKILFIILFFCFVFNFIGIGLSKYDSTATSKAKASIAFFLIEEGTYEKSLPLGKIVPSKEKYVYPFTISNYKDNKITDVAIDYTVTFITTTNLPLTYEVYKNENHTNSGAKNIISSQEIYQDENNVYYNKITIDDIGSFSFKENQTDIFNLVVSFDEKYQNNPTNYNGYIDLVKVVVDAKQKMNEGE